MLTGHLGPNWSQTEDTSERMPLASSLGAVEVPMEDEAGIPAGAVGA